MRETPNSTAASRITDPAIFPALTIARASGEPARGIAQQDGLHPSSEMAAFAADYLAPKKQLVFA